jgi:hypothetical protein
MHAPFALRRQLNRNKSAFKLAGDPPLLAVLSKSFTIAKTEAPGWLNPTTSSSLAFAGLCPLSGRLSSAAAIAEGKESWSSVGDCGAIKR